MSEDKELNVKEGRRWGSVVMEFGADMYTLLYLK